MQQEVQILAFGKGLRLELGLSFSVEAGWADALAAVAPRRWRVARPPAPKWGKVAQRPGDSHWVPRVR